MLGILEPVRLGSMGIQNSSKDLYYTNRNGK